MLLAAAWLGAGGLGMATEPLVTNVWAVQKQGTKLVDVWYDVSGVSAAIYVGLQISSNAGTTFAVSATTLSGDLGSSVLPGRNKHITWNAGTDWNNQISTTMRFRVTASSTPPVPDGFALIPAGSFQMGNALSASGDGYTSELPVHSVYVSAFYMAKYEVSKALWDDVATWAAANGYDINAAGASGKGTNHPAYYVTWYECVKWCNARSRKENLTPCYTVAGVEYKTGSSAPDCNWSANGYRLPCEAEWEKAARGGLSGKRFPWGDRISQSQANYYCYPGSYAYDDGPSGYNLIGSIGGTSPATSPVGSFAPNGYGLYDMAGNLWEWCWDWYSGNYYASSPGSDPRGAAMGSFRVLRGGSWLIAAYRCRVTDRGYGPSLSISYNSLGFRIARSLVP